VLIPSLFPAEKADGESSLGQMGKSNKNFSGAIPCSNGSMGVLLRPVNPLRYADKRLESGELGRNSRAILRSRAATP